jgi:hypothetical protein
MNLKVSLNKIKVALLSLAIYLVLDYCFPRIILPSFGEFQKFSNGEQQPLLFFISYAIPIALIVLLTVLRTTDFIYAVLSIMLLLVIFPSSILYRFLSPTYPIFEIDIVYFFSVYLISLIRLRISTPSIKEPDKVTLSLLLAIVLIIPFVFVFLPHLDFKNLLLANIYEQRAIQQEYNNSYMGYTFVPLSYVIIPLLIVLSVLHRKFLITAVAVVMILFMFLVGAHKSVFFGALLLIFFYFGDYVTKIKYFLLGSLLVLVASVIAYEIYRDFFLIGLVTRRVFFLPSLLDIGYFDLFHGKPIYWSDSILKGFIKYPLDLATPNAVGLHVMNDKITNCNNGIISDGYMNLGYAGVALNILFVSIVYMTINSLNISHRFFGLSFLAIFNFLSSYFFTSMITQGVLLFIIVAHFVLKDSIAAYDE